MKFKICVLILTIAIAAIFAVVVKLIFDENLDEWSIRFAIGAVFTALGWMWGQGKFTDMKKEELFTVIFVTAELTFLIHLPWPSPAPRT